MPSDENDHLSNEELYRKADDAVWVALHWLNDEPNEIIEEVAARLMYLDREHLQAITQAVKRAQIVLLEPKAEPCNRPTAWERLDQAGPFDPA